jgi:hypothetical protein
VGKKALFEFERTTTTTTTTPSLVPFFENARQHLSEHDEHWSIHGKFGNTSRAKNEGDGSVHDHHA